MLTKFSNEIVGSIETVNQGTSILFIAQDVCKALGYTHMHRAMSMLEYDEKFTIQIERNGQKRTVSAITESGLYHLVFLSKSASAVAFRRWVTEEVLPSLRKTGAYKIEDMSAEEGLDGMPNGLSNADMYSWYYNHKYLPKLKQCEKSIGWDTKL